MIISDTDRRYIENKYHRTDEPFDSFNRFKYHGHDYDHTTGLDDSEIKAGLASQKSAAEKIGKLLDGIELECRNLERILARKEDSSEKILDSMAQLRTLVDSLEKCVDDDLWPLPKYREMLFIN